MKIKKIDLYTILRPTLLSEYILKEFLSVLFLCLLASSGLFLVFDTFERFKVFITYHTPISTILTYLGLKIPLIIQLMLPIGTLIASIVSLGRLSQKSEITAMRASGMSIVRIAKPLILASCVLSFIMFLNGEYVVPRASEKVEQIFQFEIKQKHLSGKLNRVNFWFREKNSFINIGLFDTATKKIEGISIFEFNEDFQLKRRIDARVGTWNESKYIGWVLEDAVESGNDFEQVENLYTFGKLPLVISKSPEDLYNLQRNAETFTYGELSNYIKKLKSEGVSTRKYEVDLISKISFPLVCIVATLVAIPFAFGSTRSGSLTVGFIAAVSIGFGYYIFHALFSSFGTSGLLPVVISAWSADIVLLAVGLHLLGGAEFRS